jgi:hypothetical protein
VPDSTHADSHTPPEGLTHSAAPTQPSAIHGASNTLDPPPSAFQTPLRQYHNGDDVFSSNRYTPIRSGILNEQAPPQAENRELDQAQTEIIGSQGQSVAFSPLPSSSPLQPDISSPMTQTSPASSFLPSSPSKPLRTRATQKDPLFGRVKGAAKGSLPWSKLRFSFTRNFVILTL